MAGWWFALSWHKQRINWSIVEPWTPIESLILNDWECRAFHSMVQKLSGHRLSMNDRYHWLGMELDRSPPTMRRRLTHWFLLNLIITSTILVSPTRSITIRYLPSLVKTVVFFAPNSLLALMIFDWNIQGIGTQGVGLCTLCWRRQILHWRVSSKCLVPDRTISEFLYHWSIDWLIPSSFA